MITPQTLGEEFGEATKSRSRMQSLKKSITKEVTPTGDLELVDISAEDYQAQH